MTDHAAEARTALKEARRLRRGDWDDAAALAFAEAQVEATLAVLESQETANLIAFWGALGPGTSRKKDVGMAVFARLGLTPTTPNQEQPS